MRAILLLLVLACAPRASLPSTTTTAPPVPGKETSVPATRATGSFDVRLAPQPTDAAPLARLSIDKQFNGDLDATSKGEMLAFQSGTSGSAGYVAMERVSGTLHGRRGTFVLQHSGTMTRGAQHLDLTVVPDSGTEELAGLAGAMQIIIDEGKHSYVFDYRLE